MYMKFEFISVRLFVYTGVGNLWPKGSMTHIKVLRTPALRVLEENKYGSDTRYVKRLHTVLWYM